jgi:hypothetical protein
MGDYKEQTVIDYHSIIIQFWRIIQGGE